ncbi:hypothetical protein [Chondrinema litorale]|uniref:hypothetical protein n=1 Tax=Chondrinema litorale TaxID=2994555 RepID=UPI00254303F7|nr:hypothetical protein [Chondrinema litorale]UZR98196.1 hypothetical protein OQ292_29805 [Chondrinema litorale]
MIDPNQNTIQMSSRQKTAYTVSADENYTNWKEKIDKLLGKLKSDRKMDNMNDEIQELKAQIQKDKLDAEKHLSVLNNTASDGWHGSKESFERALENMRSSYDNMHKKYN